METKHTPTPWRVHNKYTVSARWRSYPNKTTIATVRPYPRTTEAYAEGRANAAFIVRAVNSHVALVEALECVNVWLAENAPLETDLFARNLRALKLAKEP